MSNGYDIVDFMSDVHSGLSHHEDIEAMRWEGHLTQQALHRQLQHDMLQHDIDKHHYEGLDRIELYSDCVHRDDNTTTSIVLGVIVGVFLSLSPIIIPIACVLM